MEGCGATMPPDARQSESPVFALARERLLCGMLFGAGGAAQYEALTGRPPGPFLLCVVGLAGGRPPTEQALGLLSGLPQCRGAAVFASAAGRIAVVEEPCERAGGGEAFAGSLLDALAGGLGAEDAAGAAQARGSGADEMRECYEGCDRLLGVRLREAGPGGKPEAAEVRPVLRRAMEYIEAHLGEPVTLEGAAEHAFASPCYVSRLFRRETGMGFVDYVTHMRMEKAKRLLEGTRLKVFDVAERAGIADAHYFAKLFRKHTGLSPTEYRAGKCL